MDCGREDQGRGSYTKVSFNGLFGAVPLMISDVRAYGSALAVPLRGVPASSEGRLDSLRCQAYRVATDEQEQQDVLFLLASIIVVPAPVAAQ